MVEGTSRRQQYAELTRVAVLDAATRLFASQGYASTSLEQVAVAARVSRGTVYGHFEGKQALFKAALQDQEHRLTSTLQALALSHDDPWDGCVAALRAFLDACRDTPYGHIVMREGPAALPYTEWLKCAEPYSYAVVGALLEVLVDAGRIAPVPLATTTRLAHSLLGSSAVLIAEADEDPARQAVVRQETEEMLLRLIQGLQVKTS